MAKDEESLTLPVGLFVVVVIGCLLSGEESS